MRASITLKRQKGGLLRSESPNKTQGFKTRRQPKHSTVEARDHCFRALLFSRVARSSEELARLPDAAAMA